VIEGPMVVPLKEMLTVPAVQNLADKLLTVPAVQNFADIDILFTRLASQV